MNSVFISYATEDIGFAERLATDLRDRGIYVWFDQWELRVGDSLANRINHAIKSQSYIIVILSKASVNSPWVMSELNAGFARALKEKRVVLLPVLIVKSH